MLLAALFDADGFRIGAWGIRLSLWYKAAWPLAVGRLAGVVGEVACGCVSRGANYGLLDGNEKNRVGILRFVVAS